MSPQEFYKALGFFKLGDSEAYRVAFEEGTDARYCKEYEIFKNTPDGIFVDKLSGAHLFDTKDRFNSGTGWLSFTKPVDGSVYRKADNSYGMRRIEIRSKTSDIHLGHAVGLKKLRQLQDIGHKCVLIIGDWTARIGDPTGVSATRKMLTQEEVESNAKTYLEQFFKIVDKDRTEIRWQSEWFGDFNLTNVIELTSNFTVAQILARDDFSKRFKGNHPISITELLYPLLQAYDSLAIDSQVEFGGTDQKFNLLLARELQQIHKKNPQHCFIMPLLPGTDGIQKMSKSLGNYVGINESPNDIFGKIMSIPDSLISSYYYWLTDIPTQQIEEIEKDLSNQSTNPINFKKNVALEIVSNFYSSEESESAKLFFVQIFLNLSFFFFSVFIFDQRIKTF